MKKIKLPPITIIIGIILLIGGVVFVFGPKAHQPLAENENKDSDNDGLRDWEEELFHTDPYNPDTDGDGYLDGEEVDSGHNPLVKSPGDKLTFYPLPLGDNYNITNKVLSDDIIDSILDSYFYQKGQYVSDNEIDSPETFSALVKQSTIQEMLRRAIGENYETILEKAGKTVSQIPDLFNIEISDADIKISEDNSSEAIKLYLSQITSFIASEAFFLQEQNLNALQSALQNRDFSQADKIIKINEANIESFKEIVVPSSGKEIHKQILKFSILLRNIYVSLRDVFNDPLKAYVAAQKLEDFSDSWDKLMQEIINLAKTQGIEVSLKK